MPASARSPLGGAILLAALASAACDLAVDDARREVPGGYLLMQKGDFQALHEGDGRLVRLLQDRNHDGRAEVVILYSLEKVGRSLARNGRPDTWEAEPSILRQ